jgi:PTH1 family peptidyl-tRNA hydrolase
MANIFDLFKQISSGDSTKNAPVEYIIVGLGNPGKQYENTRHNAGFLAIDYIAEKKGVKIDRAKFEGLTALTEICGKGVLLLKPQTYMNNSGQSVEAAASFYKIAPQNVIVISDDVNLDVARLRVRKSGSAGGQKGLADIITYLGTEDIPRLRIGVGKKPHPEFDMKDWVLSRFTSGDMQALAEAYPRVLVGIEKMLAGDFDGAMQLCNGK